MDILIAVVFLTLIACAYLSNARKAKRDKEEATARSQLIAGIVSSATAKLEALEKVNERATRQLKHLTSSHMVVLRRKFDQSVYRDDYGILQTEKWERELDYFVNNVIRVHPRMMRLVAETEQLLVEACQFENELPHFTTREIARHRSAITNLDRLNATFEWIAKPNLEDTPANLVLSGNLKSLVSDLVLADDDFEFTEDSDSGTPSLDSDGMDGHQYEKFCARALRNLGWDVVEKGRSGDQGVDLIGELNGFRIAFQCKYYSSPVGNAAVQEVIAGAAFEQATAGVVLSNQTYTAAAKQLASAVTPKVFLLHHDDLQWYTEMLADTNEDADTEVAA